MNMCRWSNWKGPQWVASALGALAFCFAIAATGLLVSVQANAAGAVITLGYGHMFPVCQDYLTFIQTQDINNLTYEWPLDGKKFVSQKWEPLDASKNRELIEKIVRIHNKPSPQDQATPEALEKFEQWFQERTLAPLLTETNAGRSVLQAAKFALDNSGRVNPVYRLSYPAQFHRGTYEPDRAKALRGWLYYAPADVTQNDVVELLPSWRGSVEYFYDAFTYGGRNYLFSRKGDLDDDEIRAALKQNKVQLINDLSRDFFIILDTNPQGNDPQRSAPQRPVCVFGVAYEGAAK